MKLAKFAALLFALVLGIAATASAQGTGAPATAGATAASTVFTGLNGVGMGLAIIGAGLGIGKLAASAVEGIARQPEAAGAIQLNMIIAAALIEGATFAAIIFIYLISG